MLLYPDEHCLITIGIYPVSLGRCAPILEGGEYLILKLPLVRIAQHDCPGLKFVGTFDRIRFLAVIAVDIILIAEIHHCLNNAIPTSGWHKLHLQLIKEGLVDQKLSADCLLPIAFDHLLVLEIEARAVEDWMVPG